MFPAPARTNWTKTESGWNAATYSIIQCEIQCVFFCKPYLQCTGKAIVNLKCKIHMFSNIVREEAACVHKEKYNSNRARAGAGSVIW